MGVLEKSGGRVVVAIGDYALDVQAALDLGYLNDLTPHEQSALRAYNLNAWMALNAHARRRIRHALFTLLQHGNRAAQHGDTLLFNRMQLEMALPAKIGDYTDFYSGIHHAIKAGALFRPDNPLLPNYKHLPIAYHGRASSIRVSGEPIRRPYGQVDTNEGPRLRPSERLDYELELAMWVGPGNALGEAVLLEHAPEHIAGYGLFNDWSARDIQAWEYRPLGPFQGKNFASTVSPWIITTDALIPFRLKVMSRPADHPAPLGYLYNKEDQTQGALDIQQEVRISTQKMRDCGMPAYRLAQSHTSNLYWTPTQMLTQHTLGGCNLRPGDLMASGTISTPDHTGDGSLLEMTAGGTEPIALPSGEQRTFLNDGDEIILAAYCERAGGYRIGFGECRGRIASATKRS
jgi:fumarylacetoacetase